MTWLEILGSVVAVAAIVAAVKFMGFGDAELSGESDACEQADASIHDFEARRAIVCGKGSGALVEGAAGDFVVLKRLGSHYAARRLKSPIATDIRDGDELHIESGDRFFGRVNLRFPDKAQRTAWRERLDRAP